MSAFAEQAADRQAITDKLYRYCRSVDRLDAPVGYSVFHEDSRAIYPAYDGPGRGCIDYICNSHLENYLHHAHHVTNVIIEIEGDRAGSEAYVLAKIRLLEGERLLEREFSARYVDRWSKRDGEWAIDLRRCVIDFAAIREVTPIAGFEPDGRRDRGDTSYDVLR